MINPHPHVSQADIDLAVHRARGFAINYCKNLPAWMDKDSFVGEAVMAVAVALNSYDPAAEAEFATWAHSKVVYALKERHRHKDNDPAGRARRAKIKSGEIEESGRDLPHTCIDPDDMDGQKYPFSDQQFVPSAEDIAIEMMAKEGLRTVLEGALAELPERDADVIRLRFFHGMNRLAIAQVFAVSENHIMRIEKRALAELRNLLTDTGVNDGII